MFYTPARHGALADLRHSGALKRRLPALAREATVYMFSALVYLLVFLLALCAGLMCLTAQYGVGVLVLGGVLFISLAAANWRR